MRSNPGRCASVARPRISPQTSGLISNRDIHVRKLLLLIAIVLLSLNAYRASADETLTPEKKADIERLLDMTGALALGRQLSSTMVGQFTNAVRKANPGIPKEVLDTLPAIVNSVIEENISTFKQAAVLIYHKHFSHDEMKQMIAFYSSDLGRKIILEMPTLMQEIMGAGAQWGQSLAPEIERRVRDRFKEKGVAL